MIVPQSEEGAVGVKEVANKEYAVKASKPPAKRPRGGEPSTSHNLAKRKKVQSVSTASKQPSDQDQAGVFGGGVCVCVCVCVCVFFI